MTALGNIGNSASAIPNDDTVLDKFMLQAGARELSQNPALASCLRAVIPNCDHVEILRRGTTGKAYYYNLVTCKLVWLCPVCAARISERRTRELLRILEKPQTTEALDFDGKTTHRRQPKYGLSMMTFTIGHKKYQTLEKSLSILKYSYHQMWSGRKAEKFMKAYGVVGTLRAFEITYGDQNGWHPHIHLLLVHDGMIHESFGDEIYRATVTSWLNHVKQSGGYATAERGLDVTVGEKTLVQYIDKAGQRISRTRIKDGIVFETTKTPAKHAHIEGRTLWQLLAGYCIGDYDAGALWVNAQSQIRGTKQLLASRGLQSILSSPTALEDAFTGEEYKAPTDVILARLSIDDWRVINRFGLRGRLLEQAQNSTPEQLEEWIARVMKLRDTGAIIPT